MVMFGTWQSAADFVPFESAASTQSAQDYDFKGKQASHQCALMPSTTRAILNSRDALGHEKDAPDLERRSFKATITAESRNARAGHLDAAT
eukprot:6206064-Pleurochrysis_carterae.AAC.4